MQSVKDRILEYIDRNQVASVAELSTTLGVTKPNIHYHIKNLIQSGILEIYDINDKKRRKIKGRPVHFYRRTNRSKATNYRLLSAVLMHFYLTGKGERLDQEQKLQEMAKILAGDVTRQTGSQIQHLQHAVARLEMLHYDPHWEISMSGPVIYFRHCPYADILAEFPCLCQVDTFLLERLTKSPVKQTGWIHKPGNQPPACMFIIRS